MNILILTNKPKEQFEQLCFKVLKRYCIAHNFDLLFNDEYVYNSKYSHIVYIDNSVLIIDLQINICDYISNDSDLIFLNNLNSYDKFLIVKNSENINKYDDLKYLQSKISKDKIFIINKIINMNNNNAYNYGNNIDNDNFLTKIKNDKVLFYNNNNFDISTELKNYIYHQIYNKFYFKTDFINYKLNYDKYKYTDDIEIFNPGNEIAFATLYTHHIKDEGREMEYSLKEYCLKNNYTFYIHRKSELEGRRHPCLEKPYILKKYINSHKYLIWADSDTLYLQHYYKIENIMDDKSDFIAFNDPNKIHFLLNSGFLIFKNSIVGRYIINKWIDVIEKKNITEFNGGTKGDQGLLNDIIRNDYMDKSKIYSNDQFNADVNSYNKDDVKVLHLMGIYGFIRVLLMKYINYVTFVKNLN